MNGLMEERMRENGKTTKCTEEDSLTSLTEESTRANTEMTRKTGEELITGLMVGNLKGSFIKENSTEMAFLFQRMASAEKQSSKMVRELDG